MKNVIKVAIAFAILPAASVLAQTGSQKFTVVVPTNISITPPADVTLTHDETDNDQAFPVQQWEVFGNNQSGVSVNFTTNTPFIHTVDPSFERDAQLGLALNSNNGPATWTITQASDATDFGQSDTDATVAATSNGVGRANFDLSVTFVTDSFGTFAAGNYEMTVVGTVSAN